MDALEEGGQSPPPDWWLAADGRWYPPEQRAGYVPPPPAPDRPRTPWWSDRWVIAAVGAVVLVTIGLVVFGDTSNEVAVPANQVGNDADDDRGPVQDEEWRIELGDAGAGVHTVVLIKTFSPLEEDDVQDLGGRLVWPETEIELCRVGIRAVGDGFLQIGDIFQTAEGCEGGSGMQQAFDDFGLPETACVFVRSKDVNDEHCAPLASAELCRDRASNSGRDAADRLIELGRETALGSTPIALPKGGLSRKIAAPIALEMVDCW